MCELRNKLSGAPQVCPETMETLQTSCFCRVCLKDGAAISIFENEDKKIYKDTLSKMNLCFGEVQDLPGYPRYLCYNCYHSLDEAVSLINKYNESCKLLEENLGIVIKTEISDAKDLDNYISEPEVEISIFKQDNLDIKVDFLKEESSGPFFEEFSHKSESPVSRKEKRNISDLQFKRSGKIKQKNLKSTKSIAGKRVEENGDKLLSLNSTKKATRTKIKKIVKKKVATPKKNLKENTEKRIRKNKRKRSDKSAMCELCGKYFNAYANYLRHRTIHFPERPHKCPICSKSYGCSDYLKSHIRKTHEKSTYICDDCGKVYSCRSSFIQHVKGSHLNIKRKRKWYSCTMCEKEFSTQKYTLIHERSAHTGERPAVCEVCDASFFHEDYLREHVRLHTGETPFKCPVCDKGFAQRGNMKSHIRHNHSISKLSEETLKQINTKLLKHLKP